MSNRNYSRWMTTAERFIKTSPDQEGRMRFRSVVNFGLRNGLTTAEEFCNVAGFTHEQCLAAMRGQRMGVVSSEQREATLAFVAQKGHDAGRKVPELLKPFLAN